MASTLAMALPPHTCTHATQLHNPKVHPRVMPRWVEQRARTRQLVLLLSPARPAALLPGHHEHHSAAGDTLDRCHRVGAPQWVLLSGCSAPTTAVLCAVRAPIEASAVVAPLSCRSDCPTAPLYTQTAIAPFWIKQGQRSSRSPSTMSTIMSKACCQPTKHHCISGRTYAS
jgi:hypothetical protein